MLYLEIQNGKDAINTCEYQKMIGGTILCMSILMVGKKVCVQLTQNGTYFADSWFSGLKIDEVTISERVHY